jgi:hypothetical protein
MRILAALLLYPALPAVAATLGGTVVGADGDTIMVMNQKNVQQ